MRCLLSLFVLITGAMLSGCVIPYSVQVPVVKGRAVDKDTHQPFHSASVMVTGFPETGTVTDEDGYFVTLEASEWHIFSLPLSDRFYSYELILAVPGYEPATQAFRVFRDKAVELGEIELTGVGEQEQ